MGFSLVPKSVTLNDVGTRFVMAVYFALFQFTEFGIAFGDVKV